MDADLADLYQVTAGNLNLAVKRNLERFPEDFMFQLTRKEFADRKNKGISADNPFISSLTYGFP